MITRYFTSMAATFNPLSRARSHRIPRVILAFLSPQARSPSGGNLQVSTNVLAQASGAPSSLVVQFKDGKTMVFKEGRGGDKDDSGLQAGDYDLRAYTMNDVVQELDRHSRALRRKEELSGER